MKYQLAVSVVLATMMMGGCALKKANNVHEDNVSTTPDRVLEKEIRKSNNPIDDMIFYQQGISGDHETSSLPLSPNNIVVEKRGEDVELLPLELRKASIDHMDYTGKSLGNVFKLLMTQTKSVGLIVEPNVDLNKKVIGIVKNKNMYEAMQSIARFSGYDAYYDASQKSIIVSPFAQRKYYIPAGVFVERGAKVSLSGAGEGGGAVAPEFDMNNGNVYETFMNGLKSVGTEEKLISVDKQTGVVYVKERALFIEEVDDYIKEFVANRIEQYQVELVVLQIAKNKAEEFQLDMQDILIGKNFSITSLAGGAMSAKMAAQNGNAVISGGYGYNPDGTRKSAGNTAFNSFLHMVNKKKYGNIVTRPQTLVQNHSIGFITIGKEISYLASVEKEPDTFENGTKIKGAVTPKIETYMDGIQFAIRVDKHPRKDFIQLSLAKHMSDAVQKPFVFDGNTLIALEKDIKEGFFSANVRDGDLIVLGGFKQDKGEDSKNAPLSAALGETFLDKIFKDTKSAKDSYETIFLVKINKINTAKESYDGTGSHSIKNLYREQQ